MKASKPIGKKRICGKEGIQLIHEIGRRITYATGEKRVTKFLFQTLSITLQLGNVASILGTFPPAKKLTEIFYL